MKYRAAATTCGCGKPRRKGGRYCKECHAASQRRARAADPIEVLSKTMARIARPGGKRALPPDMQATLDAMAKRVAREIEEFNRMAGAA